MGVQENTQWLSGYILQWWYNAVMNEITKSTRRDAVTQVLHSVHTGKSVSAACREVGIPRSSYYAFLDQNPEVLAEFQAMIKANTQMQLAAILANDTPILLRIIQDALSDNTSPRDRLAIYIALQKMTADAVEALQLEDPHKQISADFLKRGLQQLPAVSRLSASGNGENAREKQ